MKKLFLVSLMGLLFSFYNAYGDGCDTKVVEVHEVQGKECPQNEVLVGAVKLSLANPIIKCGKIECSCKCEPDLNEWDLR